MTAFILNVPSQDVEVASDRLWQLGVRAVEERRVDDRSGAVSGAGSIDPGDRVELWTSLGADPIPTSIEQLGLKDDWTWRTEYVDAISAETWRASAAPMIVADRVVVVPAWQEPPAVASNLVPIFIEPAGAFGFGDHPTTSLSLGAVVAALLAHNGAESRPPSVLDVGCGTGLLAIAASLLGARPVRAIDVSMAAVESTRDNSRRNGVDGDVLVDDRRCEDLDGTYDIVVANILAPALVSLAPTLVRLTAQRGRLIVSGILAARHGHVLDALSPMVVEEVTEDATWVALTLCHPTVSA
ncbi:MAG: 50S ribosomal protein L11 methyltransferase [Acidimicrobiia bacterium]|nr:50S ribosomal protein L11 methyltransferase [Acidimicrobiia bacterium]